VQAFAQRLRAVIKTMVIKTEPSSKMASCPYAAALCDAVQLARAASVLGKT